MEGGGLCLACKFQSRLRYPSGTLADSQNQFGEGGLASTFLCFCFHLSPPFTLLSSLFITVFLFSPIHPFTSYPSITHSLPTSIWLFVFTSSHPSIRFLSFSAPACLQAVINQHSYLVGGCEECEAQLLMLTGGREDGVGRSEVTRSTTDGFAVWMLWQRFSGMDTWACVHMKSLSNARKACTHAYTQTYRQAGVSERGQVVWWGRLAEMRGGQVEYITDIMCENPITPTFCDFQVQ